MGGGGVAWLHMHCVSSARVSLSVSDHAVHASNGDFLRFTHALSSFKKTSLTFYSHARPGWGGDVLASVTTMLGPAESRL